MITAIPRHLENPVGQTATQEAPFLSLMPGEFSSFIMPVPTGSYKSPARPIIAGLAEPDPNAIFLRAMRSCLHGKALLVRCPRYRVSSRPSVLRKQSLSLSKPRRSRSRAPLAGPQRSSSRLSSPDLGRTDGRNCALMLKGRPRSPASSQPQQAPFWPTEHRVETSEESRPASCMSERGRSRHAYQAPVRSREHDRSDPHHLDDVSSRGLVPW